MAAGAEKFAAGDEAQKKHIEIFNSPSSYVNGLKSQLGDSDGLGGRVDSDDKKTLLDAITSIPQAVFCMRTSLST